MAEESPAPKRGQFGWLRIAMGFILTIILLLGANLIAATLLGGIKIDMTEENLYTLSKGSKDLLAKLEDSVKIKLFESKRVVNLDPRLKQYSARVNELLKQYVAASDGKITLEILEPRPDDPTEEEAVRYGIQAVSIGANELLYFGLVLENETGDVEVMPFLHFNREQFIEYDISRLLSAVGTPEKRVVGVLSPLNVMGGYANPMDQFSERPSQPSWVFIQELQSNHDVRTVEMDATSIPSDVDLLLVIHPKEISPLTEYALDQYLLGGGRLVVMIDPLCQYEQTSSPTANPTDQFSRNYDSTLPTLLPAWGIAVDTSKVVGDINLALSVPTQTGQRVKFPPYVQLGEKNLNSEEIVSSDLESVLLLYAARLAKTPSAPYELTPLMETTESAGELDGFMLKISRDPEQVQKDLIPGSEKLTLAYKISGKFKSAFPGGRPAGDDGETPASPMSGHVGEASEESTIIVFGDVDFAWDDTTVRKQQLLGMTFVEPFNDNLKLLQNAVENLLGSSELIGLRTRGKASRPFERVLAIERAAQERWKAREEALNAEVQDINSRLMQLEGGREGGQQAGILTADQKKLVEEYRENLAQTKRDLREVRRNLRVDIEKLGARLKSINIILWPLTILLLSFLPVVWRAVQVR
jgi:ABC-type uncharacterized transport system involved in gliding motility auxiliary subunit